MIGAVVRGLVVALAVLASPASAVAQGPDAVFDRANEAYAAGRYSEAVEGYLELARLGVEDPRLEYNLGNALFKAGRIGPAILHWERARKLDPIDRDIAANLAYARSLIEDRVEVPAAATSVRLVRALQDRVGPDRHAIAVVVLWWAVALLIAWAFSRPGRWTARIGWALASGLLAITLVACSWWFTWQRVDGREQAVVVAPAADVRAGPGENNATLVTIHEGLTVRVRQLRDGWVQVTLPDGLNGWIRQDLVGIV